MIYETEHVCKHKHITQWQSALLRTFVLNMSINILHYGSPNLITMLKKHATGREWTRASEIKSTYYLPEEV